MSDDYQSDHDFDWHPMQPDNLLNRPRAPIMRPCEGSGYVGHPVWRGDLFGEGVMCQMCGQVFARLGAHDYVAEHQRPDLIAMIDRGDFNG